MVTSTLALIAWAAIAAPPETPVPLAAGGFLEKIAAVSSHYRLAADRFLLRPSTRTRPAGRARTELDSTLGWVHRILKPLFRDGLASAEWAAYVDKDHPIEPLVAKTTVGDETFWWSAADGTLAVLCDLGQTTSLTDKATAEEFAIRWVEAHVAAPERSDKGIEAGMKRYDKIWGGFVNRALKPVGVGHKVGDGYWDSSMLFITDGQHVLLRLAMTDPEETDRRTRSGIGPANSGAVRPKTKSRFDK